MTEKEEDGKPLSRTHKETTLAGAERIQKIAETVHANGGKIISNINVTLAWLVGNVEFIRMRCWQDLIRIRVRFWM